MIKKIFKVFNKVVNAIFSDNEISKESIQYICIIAINIDSITRLDKKTILKFI